MQISDLNDAQRLAVETTEGPLLILAGAGSGKTKAITYRIAYLIEEKGVSPYHILAITFTNKAAQELQERIINLAGPAGKRVWAKTFHATALQILRFESDFIPYEDNFVIYDSADQLTLIKRILKESDIDEKSVSPRSVLADISREKNALHSPEDTRKAAEGDESGTELADLYMSYQQALRRQNAMDFDDIIYQAIQLFQNNPDILKKYQDRFQYIMVDEYQDTNYAQYVFIKLLADHYKNICVVGDDDQSIYEWRGADIRNILDFEQHYPDAKVIKLEKNYRSGQFILKAANGVIANNIERKEKNLWTDRNEGDKVKLYMALDDTDEAFFISRHIQQLMGEEGAGLQYKDFAVLCRMTAQFRKIEEDFIQRKIPYRIFGGVKFYSRKEIKDMLAYLTILANPYDMLALERALQTPRRGIGDGSIDKIRKLMQTSSISGLEALARANEVITTKKILKAIGEFLALIADAQKIYRKTYSLATLTEFILDESGYRDMLLNEDSVDAETRLDYLNQFLATAAEFDDGHDDLEDAALTVFLSDLALYTDTDDYSARQNSVSIMTLHSAKGLEFPVVFIPGMEEGVFPHAYRLLDESELEEERRLCYVGITRAKSHLFLLRAQKRMLYGKGQSNAPSRFIDEIPPLVLDDLNSRHHKTSPAKENKHAERPKANAVEFYVGDKISHQLWGEGAVVAVDNKGPFTQISVMFPEMGLKKLISAYAPIEKID